MTPILQVLTWVGLMAFLEIMEYLFSILRKMYLQIQLSRLKFQLFVNAFLLQLLPNGSNVSPFFIESDSHNAVSWFSNTFLQLHGGSKIPSENVSFILVDLYPGLSCTFVKRVMRPLISQLDYVKLVRTLLILSDCSLSSLYSIGDTFWCFSLLLFNE